ncbi:MAG: Ni/Fe hydrogenase subunit alpha [Desulfocapsaceae bacterium]|nr:Ni/Fe hydrogenase subunit alpha [Desulfocapsaceae bacterium]
MAETITIEPITRIEGHGKITIILDDDGQVSDARFHVTQFRGFEKLCEGRPYYEMPAITERICGICPVSHALASGKACDAILGVHPPEAASLLRRLLNCGEFIQSHALSFFYLSSPDLFLGMDADPAKRNITGIIEAYPEMARDGIRLRKIGQQIIEMISGKRIHASWVVPGGVNAPLDAGHRQTMLQMIPEALEIIIRTLALFKKTLDQHREEIRTFANFPTYFMGMVDEEGNLEHVSGRLRIIDAKGHIVADAIDPADYREYIAEAVEPWSYLKFPYYKPLGFPAGIYRVGPAARLNVCNGCGTALADQEWAEFREIERGPLMSSFFNHYARLIEILFCIETMQGLLAEPAILAARVRAVAQPNFPEGVGCVEAPRGTLIHHYRVDEDGLMTWANLIVATGHNTMAMSRGVLQVAKRFITGAKITEGALNRVEALIRAFDPCLSCSTHALGQAPFTIRFMKTDGTILGET